MASSEVSCISNAELAICRLVEETRGHETFKYLGPGCLANFESTQFLCSVGTARGTAPNSNKVDSNNFLVASNQVLTKGHLKALEKQEREKRNKKREPSVKIVAEFPGIKDRGKLERKPLSELYRSLEDDVFELNGIIYVALTNLEPRRFGIKSSLISRALEAIDTEKVLTTSDQLQCLVFCGEGTASSREDRNVCELSTGKYDLLQFDSVLVENDESRFPSCYFLRNEESKRFFEEGDFEKDERPLGAIIVNKDWKLAGVLNFISKHPSPVIVGSSLETDTVDYNTHSSLHGAAVSKAGEKPNETETEMLVGASGGVYPLLDDPPSKSEVGTEAANNLPQPATTPSRNQFVAGLNMTDDNKGEDISADHGATYEPELLIVNGEKGHEKRDQAKIIFHNLQQMCKDTDKKISEKTTLLSDLAKNAQYKGFVVSNNPGQGDCMFYSLSEQLERTKEIKLSAAELRKELVQYLKEHPKRPDGTDLFHFTLGYLSWPAYLEKMAQDGTWGDHVILLAAANCYNTTIRVISSLLGCDDIIINPDQPVCHSNDALVLGHVHEAHYVSLLPIPDFTKGTSSPTENSYRSFHFNSYNKTDVKEVVTLVNLPPENGVKEEPPVAGPGGKLSHRTNTQGAQGNTIEPQDRSRDNSPRSPDSGRRNSLPLYPPPRVEHPQGTFRSISSAEEKRKLHLSDPLTKTILGFLELLEALGRCLDKEYKYGQCKCWKHIAEVFDIPEEEYENFICNKVHSPTEVMFEYLQSVRPDITVGDLKHGLNQIERQDVIAILIKHEKCDQSTLNDKTVVCSLFDSDPDIIGEMAFMLDKQKSGLKKWSHLAAKLGIARTKFKSFETSSTDNPTKKLFEILKVHFPGMTVAELISHLEAMERRDVIIAIKESKKELRVIKELMADLDVMDNVCELLNKKKRTTKVLGLEHLGTRLGVKKEILDDLLPTEEETQSPTEAVLRHLGGWKPWLTLSEFIWALHNIDRFDVITVLDIYFPDGCIPNLFKSSCNCERCQQFLLRQRGDTCTSIDLL